MALAGTLGGFLVRSRVELVWLAVPSYWPVPGSEDTEFGVLMEPEVRHGETEVYARVQA
jgi:hypothetical protein